MFAQKTLLVIGAGASREVELPVGEDLAKSIANLLDYEFDFGTLQKGDRDFLRLLQRSFTDRGQLNEHLALGQRIRDGVRNAGSIDNFIDIHRDDPRVAVLGKSAIIYLILQAEASSLLSLKGPSGRASMDFDKLYRQQTWYPKFGRLLRDQVALADVDSIFDNLTIICFNYDRCIEHFLIHWLESIFGIERSVSQDLVQRLEIYRPYGRIGPPWGPGALEFGCEPDRINLSGLVGNIKTYTEQVEDTKLLADLRMAVGDAETIIFLGFAFHPQNLSLLSPGAIKPTKRVFATANGFSKPDAENIRTRIISLLGVSDPTQILIRPDLKCGSLFDEYQLSLSA